MLSPIAFEQQQNLKLQGVWQTRGYSLTCGCGVAHDQACKELLRLQRRVESNDRANGSFCHFGDRLLNRRESRHNKICKRDVVKANDGQIGWDRQTKVTRRPDCANGLLVAGCSDGGNPLSSRFAQKFAGDLFSGLKVKFSLVNLDQKGNPVRRNCLGSIEESLQAFTCVDVILRTRQIGDPAVPKFDQMVERPGRTLLLIDSNACIADRWPVD